MLYRNGFLNHGIGDIMESHDASDLVDESIMMFTDASADFTVQEPDARRYKTCLQITTGKSLLDIGINHGILVNAAVMSGQFEEIVGVDLTRSPYAIIGKEITFRQISILDPDFVTRQFDTVVCMEVVEHLEAEHNDIILKNLRESTRKRLIVTVPFNEPEPLWWHDKPGGHRQKFTLKKLGELFPNAIATIEPRWGVEWVFVVEDQSLDIKHFQLVTKDKFIELLIDN